MPYLWHCQLTRSQNVSQTLIIREKKSLSFFMGPPNEAAHWLLFSWGSGVADCFRNQSFELSSCCC